MLRILGFTLAACLLFGCSNKAAEFHAEEVPATETDAFFSPDINRIDEIGPDGESRTGSLYLNQATGLAAPLVVTHSSMFSPGGVNPLLIKFDKQGQVDDVVRLTFFRGTVSEHEKKGLELKPDSDMIDKLYASVRAKKLDMRKPEDRSALIEEVINSFGEKTRSSGIRFYEGDWKLRYRWPAKSKG